MMSMTHYMELLATNQPWNLIIYMAIPVILAELVAVTELYVLFKRDVNGPVRRINRIAGIILGFYFLVIFLNLFTTAFIPTTLKGEWRGIGDFIAVGTYLLGVVPLLGIALLDINILGRHMTEEQKMIIHAIFVGIFLVVAHVAMIFGMLSPEILMPKVYY